MADITISTPNGWVLPENSPLKRDWVAQVYEKDLLVLAEQNQDRYDVSSIFYDISYCYQRGIFYTVGPPFLNLADTLFPLSMRYSTDGGETFTPCEPKQLPHWLTAGITVFQMKVGPLEAQELLLEVTLGNGDCKSFTINNARPAPRDIVMNTMQKNNEPSWIVDWVNYYRAYGVFDFHIYDNGSDDLDSVVQALEKDVPADVKVHIVRWPYRYGIPQILYSMFSQNSTIMDFVLQAQDARWAINCDIDEYIFINPEFEQMTDFLDSFDEETCCVQIGCSDAFLMQGEAYPEALSIRDLNWRSKEIRPKFKNAFKPAIIHSASVHYVKPMEGTTTIFPDESACFYFHALPLNSGWTHNLRAKTRANKDGGKFVEDRRIAERMRWVDGLD